MVFNATFNNISVISWRSILLVEETRGPGENHRLVAIKQLNTKKPTTNDVAPGSSLGQPQKCGRVKPVYWIATLAL